MEGKATQDMRAREVVDEGLEVLQHGRTGGLVHVEIELGVGKKQECAQQV